LPKVNSPGKAAVFKSQTRQKSHVPNATLLAAAGRPSTLPGFGGEREGERGREGIRERETGKEREREREKESRVR